MSVARSVAVCFSALLMLAAGGVQPPPAVPAWPDKFTVQLGIYVEKYGKEWSSKGVLFYDWTSKVCN